MDRTILFGLVWISLSGLSLAAVEQETATFDGGGRAATSANYVLHGSIGGWGGMAAAVAPEQTIRHGFIGQLTEIESLSLRADPANIPEQTTAQLRAAAVHHDGIQTLLNAADVDWEAAAWPLASIDAAGLATAAIVYQDTPAPFSATYRAIAGTSEASVIDVDPDNFGAYAGDGLPDHWQVLHFGIDNPDAAPNADPTASGQNNTFRYIAGLNPTNRAERFVLEVRTVAGEPGQRALVYRPLVAGRVYTVLHQTDPGAVPGEWAPIVLHDPPDISGDQAIVIDSAADGIVKYYRMRIGLP